MFDQFDIPQRDLLLLGVVFLAAATIWRIYQRNNVLSAVPGPRSASWLFGNEWQIYNAPAGELWNRWIAQYGPIVKYRNAFFNGNTLLVADPVAIKAILTDGPDAYAFHKPPFNRQTNQRMLGKGVIWAEGDDHKKQRRLLSPAFTNPATNQMSPAFYQAASDLKSAWHDLAASSSSKEIVLNVGDWMSRAALDVIGVAGFQHRFQAVISATKESSSITHGLSKAFGAPPSFNMFLSLNLAKSFPFFFNYAPLKAIRSQRASKASIDAVAAKILANAEQSEAKDDKSVLSIILKERKKGNGLTDAEIIDNFATMITAGHETTGITLSLVLYELSRNSSLQQRVRDEINGDGTHPSFEELQSGDRVPLLDAVVKEVLRLYPANIRIIRTAEKEMVIPVSTSLGTVTIPAGTDIVFPIAAINTLQSAWGRDAAMFRPERWLEPGGIPDTVKSLPAGYHHIFTFISGPRACLGMRFAIAEMRVILSEIVSSFRFEPIDDSGLPLDIVSPAQIMIRAQDSSRGIYGVPLRVKPVHS
ncbi:hypothetical protein PLICRDRAFT_494881, partial [Plicaturopsis crispa FD-325 SS-3]